MALPQDIITTPPPAQQKSLKRYPRAGVALDRILQIGLFFFFFLLPSHPRRTPTRNAMRLNDAILAVCCCFSILRTCASENQCPGGWPICPRHVMLGKLVTRDVEIRRYEGGMYLERISPSDTYGFTCSYAYFDLINYFNGNNLHQERFPKSTPLIVTVGRLHLKGLRKGRFYIGDLNGRVAAPFSPARLVEVKPTTYYVRRIERTLDFTVILTRIEEMMSDLLEMERPIDPSLAHVLHYEFPEGGNYTGPNEILVEKLTDAFESSVEDFRDQIF
ncbi:hypothetical protein BSKO_13026 [Bryopsis sp. KO-2023]|nr:hypothetical protein BSKO_13026 [Bryopsis sp. KO-2023]